jgi:PEGA domain-containing protein
VKRLLVLFALLVLTAPADAQSTDEQAQKLFREGVDAQTAGNYAAACAKFEQSLALVSRASTLLNLAICEAEQGKLTSALARYAAGIDALTEGDERIAEARRGMAALDARVPRLTIKLGGDTPASARVLVDGHEVPQEDRVRLPLDPGKHQVVLALGGHDDATRTVSLRESATETVTMEPGPATGTGAPPAEPGAEPAPEPEAPADDGAPIDPLLPAGITVAGLGVAGLAVGAALGAMTLSETSNAESDPTLCPNKVCTQAGREAVDGARGKGVGATVALAVGGAALAAGVVMIIVSQTAADEPATSARITPLVGPNGAGAILELPF